MIGGSITGPAPWRDLVPDDACSAVLLASAGAALLGAFRRGASDVAAHHGSSGPGDPCRNDNQCLGADAPLVCAWNGFDYDGDLNCCTYEGNRCGFDEACCGLA